LQVQGYKERQSDVLHTLIALQSIEQSSEMRTQLLQKESEEKKNIIKHRIAELKSLANERKLATKKTSKASIIRHNHQESHKTTVDSSFITTQTTRMEENCASMQSKEEESTQDYKPFVLSRFRKSPSNAQMPGNYNPCPKKSKVEEQKPEPLKYSPSDINREGGMWNEWRYRVGIFKSKLVYQSQLLMRTILSSKEISTGILLASLMVLKLLKKSCMKIASGA